MSASPGGWADVAPLARQLVSAWGCWCPMLDPHGTRVAYICDRAGVPQAWVQDIAGGNAQRLPLSADPVVAVSWSPDGRWLGCEVATGGGVRTEVWVVRPDGTGARRVAGGDQHARLGPWARDGGGGLVVTLSSDAGGPNECLLVDPETDLRELVARGGLIAMLDLTEDGRFALLRDGSRGAQFCRLVDRSSDLDHPVLPYADRGSTDVGLLRPAPPGASDQSDQVVYLVTDAGLPRRQLVAIGIREDGRRIAAGVVAARDDAELEFADADDAGALLVLVWNVDGRSEIDLFDATSGRRRPCSVPGEVVSSIVLSRDGSCLVAAVESSVAPRRLWHFDVSTSVWTPVTPSSLSDGAALVRPELVRFQAHDGLPLSGWLYLPRERTGAAVVSLHGGPEAQERPGFDAQHQVLVAAGIAVFAPNIRGSSGYGHSFVHADDRWGRLDAIRDVAECARVLVERGWADRDRIAVGGRSYGGYATLLALVRHGAAFAAGIDICGMSDLLTFFENTEPWIAAAAVTKYGHPAHDAALLAEVSPIHHLEAIDVPLLVVHGELDTNVPLTEATQLVARLRLLGKEVEYLELPGEGHDYRRAESRVRLLESLTGFLGRCLDGRRLSGASPR